MKRILSFGLLSSFLLAALPLTAQDAAQANQAQIENTRTYIQQYVENRRKIAEAKNEWEAQKELIQRNLELYRAEKTELEETIRTAEERVSTAEKVIAEKREAIAELRAANDIVKNALPEIEAQLRELVLYFPKPLKNRLSGLTGQIGRSNQTSNRMSTVVGILNEMNKFNAEYSLDEDTQGDKFIDVLYVGLSQAYYVSEDGSVAGIMYPAKNEWRQEPRPELAASIQRAIEYFKGNQKPAEFVPLPFEVITIETGL